MNFNTVKLGFEEYLIQQGKLEPKELRKNSQEDVSILSNAKEFKEYLNKTYSIDSSQIQYDNIDSILRFLNDEAQKEDEQGESELSDDDKFLQEMLDDLMQDEKFIDTIDCDDNSEISEEELSSFLDYVKENSEDSETLTLEDILTVAEQIQSGEFTYGESEFTQEDFEQIEGDMQDTYSPSVSFEPSGTPQATSTTRGYTATSSAIRTTCTPRCWRASATTSDGCWSARTRR